MALEPPWEIYKCSIFLEVDVHNMCFLKHQVLHNVFMIGKTYLFFDF